VFDGLLTVAVSHSEVSAHGATPDTVAAMRFTIDQRFRATAGEVGGALSSVDYLSTAMGELPDISRPEIRSHHVDGSEVTLNLEYRFAGSLPSVVTRVIDTAKLSWIEDTRINTSTWTATFTMTPTHYAHFFTCRGSWTLVEAKGVTLRSIDGVLKVNSPVPFVGGQVEKAIVSGLRERLAKEPVLLENWVSSNRST
jgi:hypothetical protein